MSGIAAAVIGGLSQLGSGLLGYFGLKSANKTNMRLAKRLEA